jgi:hypothetical protein
MSDDAPAPPKLRMYILVHESVPIGFAVLAAVHASLAAYLKFADTPEVKEWLAGPFYKAVSRHGRGIRQSEGDRGSRRHHGVRT